MTVESQSNQATSTAPDGLLVRFALRLLDDRRLLVLILGVVFVAGLSSLMILPRMEDPVLAQRVAIVNTRLPGADAERVEALITEKIEDSLRDIREIKEIRSQSRSGISSITIELLDRLTETAPIWSEVRSKIEDALPQLPAEAERPSFDELEVRAYARIVSLVWRGDAEVDYAVLRRTSRQLQDRLQGIPGTEAVDRFGDPGEEVLVQVDPDQAAAIGLSVDAVAAQLAAADAKEAAGQLRGDLQDLPLEVSNQFEDVAEIGRTNLRSNDGRFVRLDQIATVGIEPQYPLPRAARHGDAPAISLGVLIRPEVRIDHWAKRADEKLADFSALLPAGLEIVEVMDQSEFVSARLSSLTKNLGLGGLAVCLVIFVLMGWRSSLVVALALPLTVMTVLFGMRLWGIPIHQMSITGLIIALGLLIDNAIVVADEVRRELTAGHSPAQAVRATVGKLAVPLLGSTLTTALAFAPIALMPGPAGEFVGSIAENVIMAIAASLVFSLTVIAAIAAMWLRVDGTRATVRRRVASAGNKWGKSLAWIRAIAVAGFASQRLTQSYRTVLTWWIARPLRAVFMAMVLPLTGFALAPTLAEQFFPPSDRNQFYVEVELSPGASLADTRRISRRIDRVIDGLGIEQVDWYFGESAPTFYYNVIASRQGAPGFAQAIVRTDSTEGVGEVIRTLQVRLDQTVPEARVLVRQLEQGPPFNAPVEVRLFGPDLVRLQEYGQQVREILAGVPDVTHTASLVTETLPKVGLKVDAESARLAGLSPRDVSRQVQAAFDGRLAGSVIQETEQLPVRVRYANESRGSLNDLRRMDLVSAEPNDDSEGGEQTIPLRSLADLQLQPETGIIVRLDRRRMNEVMAYLTAGTLPSTALEEFKRRLDASGFSMPDGYDLAYGGEASKRNDAVGNLLASVGVLVAMMVTTLVLSFRSFRLAAVIGGVGILSVGLGLLALWIGGYPFGFMAIIGAMGLVGIAINDSIVVLATLQEEHGAEARDIDGVVESVVRCTRHVVATTLTTVAGFSPLIWDGGQFWPPLAVAIAGGVLGATLLALVFVPAGFRLVYCRVGCERPAEQRSANAAYPPEASSGLAGASA